MGKNSAIWELISGCSDQPVRCLLAFISASTHAFDLVFVLSHSSLNEVWDKNKK